MTTAFIHSFQGEWLKKKRSLASWLVVGGAFFIPSILLAIRIANFGKLPEMYAAEDFWAALWKQSWEPMATFLMPIGIILATALIAQIEYKNNGWKQLHTTPQTFTTIFFAKLLVIVSMFAGLMILFNVGIFLVAVIPAALFASVPYPSALIPYELFLTRNLKFFLDSLPILGLQYLLSLQFKNFLVPLGIGFFLWMLCLGFLSWEHSYIFPYAYSSLDHFANSGDLPARKYNLQIIAIGYFAVFTLAGYLLYITKRDKGE